MGLNQIANAIGTGLNQFATHSAQAASRANGVSAAAQSAQGSFNQNSANINLSNLTFISSKYIWIYSISLNFI